MVCGKETIELALCGECGGAGVEFRGHGLDMQYKICSAYMTTDTPPNHPTVAQVKGVIDGKFRSIRPSGRFA